MYRICDTFGESHTYVMFIRLTVDLVTGRSYLTVDVFLADMYSTNIWQIYVPLNILPGLVQRLIVEDNDLIRRVFHWFMIGNIFRLVVPSCLGLPNLDSDDADNSGIDC